MPSHFIFLSREACFRLEDEDNGNIVFFPAFCYLTQQSCVLFAPLHGWGLEPQPTGLTVCLTISVSLFPGPMLCIGIMAGRPWWQAHPKQVEVYSELRDTPIEENFSQIARLTQMARLSIQRGTATKPGSTGLACLFQFSEIGP